MSAEVVKKRGRPKKVISDPVEVEVPEATKKTTTRAKSTKAGPKTATAKASTSAKPPVAATPISKPIASSAAAPKVVAKPSGNSAATQTKPPLAKPIVKTPVSPESSKILKDLREQYPKIVSPTANPAKYSKPPPASIAQTKAASPPPTASANSNKAPIKSAPASLKPTSVAANSRPPPFTPKPVTAPSKPSPVVAKTTPPPPSTKPTPKPHMPIAALNSEIVSNISSRAGARPNVSQGNPLPKNYKSVANKVTMAIVAMPIALVTSWVLYERLVLGQDRKHLVKPGMAMVETPAAGETEAEISASPST